MSDCRYSDGANQVDTWSSLDDMVWNDFGRQDDHIVPGAEGDDWMAPADRRRKGPRDLTTTGLAVLKAGGNQGTNKEEFSAAQGWSGVASEAVDGTKQAITLSRIEYAGVPLLPAKLSAGHVSPTSPVELTAGAVGSIHPGRGQSVKDEMKDETLYRSGQIYDGEGPAVVSTSCHFSLNDDRPADGDVELFEGEEDDCNPRGIGWYHNRPRQRDASLRPSPPKTPFSLKTNNGMLSPRPATMEEKHAEETQELVRQHQDQRVKLVAQQEEQKAMFQHQQSLLETKEPEKQRQMESGEEQRKKSNARQQEWEADKASDDKAPSHGPDSSNASEQTPKKCPKPSAKKWAGVAKIKRKGAVASSPSTPQSALCRSASMSPRPPPPPIPRPVIRQNLMATTVHHHSPMPPHQPTLLPHNQAACMYQHPSAPLHTPPSLPRPSHFQQMQPLGPLLAPFSGNGPPPPTSLPPSFPQPPPSPPTVQEEKVDRLKRRNEQRVAAEHSQRVQQHQIAEQQQQQLAELRQLVEADEREVNLFRSSSGPSLPSGRGEEGTTGSVVGSNAGPGSADASGGGRESGEAEKQAIDITGLHQLEMTMTKLDMRTRLCIRDALYRLASSAESRKGGEGGEQTEHQLSNGVFVETETNPIDRNIANLLFQRPASGPPHHRLSSHSSVDPLQIASMATLAPNHMLHLQLQQTPFMIGTGMQGEEPWGTPWISSGMPPGMLPSSHTNLAGGEGANGQSCPDTTGRLTSNTSFLATADDTAEVGCSVPGRWGEGWPGVPQEQTVVGSGRECGQAGNSGRELLGRVEGTERYAKVGGRGEEGLGGRGEEKNSGAPCVCSSDKARGKGAGGKRQRSLETSKGKGGGGKQKSQKGQGIKQNGAPGAQKDWI